MIFYIFLSSLAFTITAFISSVLVRLSPNGKVFVDVPNHRKVHKKKIARNGGLAMFLAILIAWIISIIVNKDIFSYQLMLAIFLVFITGLLDDAFELNFKIKFLIQFIAATVCIQNGFMIKAIPIAPFGEIESLTMRVVLTYLWIIGITNAINLIDGIDGLASLVVISSGMFLFLRFKDPLALILIATCVGFLIYNWNPAKIFMGDSGSYLLGFIISLLTLQNFTSSENTWLIGMGIFLGYPVLETLYSFLRRTIQRKNPFSADQEHFHHQLLKRGLSQKMVLFNLLSLSLLFNFLGLFLYRNSLIGIIIYVLLSTFFYFYVRFPVDVKRSL